MQARAMEAFGAPGQTKADAPVVATTTGVIPEPVATVLAAVTRQTGVPAVLLLGVGRGKAPVAHARQLAMYLVHTLFGFSLTEVGRLFGRDRTTVAHACALIEDRRDDTGFDADVAELEQYILAQALGREDEL